MYAYRLIHHRIIRARINMNLSRFESKDIIFSWRMSDDNDEKDNKDECYSLPPLFKFKCLHDLESTWWIALWVLFHHVPLGDDGEEDHSAQIKHAAELFPSVGISSSRAYTFTGGMYQVPYTASSAGLSA